MLIMKFERPTLILPRSSDGSESLVFEVGDENWSMSAHIECERITIIKAANKVDVKDYDKDICNYKSIIYPNGGAICFECPKDEYLQIILHHSNGTEELIEEFISTSNMSHTFIIKTKGCPLNIMPVIKGFSGSIIYDGINKYRTKVECMINGYTSITPIFNEFINNKIRNIDITTIQMDRINNKQYRDTGVSEIKIVNANEPFRIEPLGYECRMWAMYPTSTNPYQRKHISDLKWFINQY